MSELLAKMGEAQAKFKEVTDLMEKKKAELDAQQAEINEAKKELAEIGNKIYFVVISNPIRLNVGGQVFVTTLSTVTSIKGTFFEAMFSGQFNVKPADDGTFCIDRDPFVFRHVLNYLRGEVLNLIHLSKAELEALKKDAEFYQIPGLIELMQEKKSPLVWKSGPNYNVIAEGKGISKTDSGSWTTAISTGFTEKWAIKINHSEYGHIIIGFVQSTVTQTNLPSTNSWLLNLQNGNLYPGGAAYGIKCTSGKVIVELNVQREILYTINGVKYGVAYRNIPMIDLVACVSLHTPGDSVQFVDCD